MEFVTAGCISQARDNNRNYCPDGDEDILQETAVTVLMNKFSLLAFNHCHIETRVTY